MIVDFKATQECIMISRTSKSLVKFAALAGMASSASVGHAGTAAVTPALAACSKALIETLAKAETMPAYKVKAPSQFLSDIVDPNSYTVVAKNIKTNELLAKASCKATPTGEIVSFKSIPVKS
jgi:hypothetical protein